MDMQELNKARQQVQELERQMFEEIREKAAMLGLVLVESTDAPPKLRRKRRTKAEIEAERSAPNG